MKYKYNNVVIINNEPCVMYRNYPLPLYIVERYESCNDSADESIKDAYWDTRFEEDFSLDD